MTSSYAGRLPSGPSVGQPCAWQKITFGFRARTSSYVSPSRPSGPGRRLVTTMSARSASRRHASRPDGCLRSSEMLRLLRSRFSDTPDNCGCGPGPMNRLVSPWMSSTLITSAPRSPRIWVAIGPMTTDVRSSTRTSESGPSGSDMCAVGLVSLAGTVRHAGHRGRA